MCVTGRVTARHSPFANHGYGQCANATTIPFGELVMTSGCMRADR